MKRLAYIVECCGGWFSLMLVGTALSLAAIVIVRGWIG